jgi:beta-aspartyl-peptidase (threonine type)
MTWISTHRPAFFVCCLLLCAGCAPSSPPPDADGGAAPRWAFAIHGGAGGLSRDGIDSDREAAIRAALEGALRAGVESLEGGASSLDTIERVLRILEDDPLFNAGKGAVYTHEGTHELDAAVMRGEDLATGAVAGVRNVKNPVSLARLVMERTEHVLLVGSGAEAFANEMGVALVEQDYFHTEERFKALERARGAEREPDEKHGTVGAVALDQAGNLAAATSTGGRTNKRFGRVGDVPIVGAGTYANNQTCAVSGTGKGEEFIRHAVAGSISKLMEYRGSSLEEAAREIIHGILEPNDGGVIAVGADGSIAMEFNTEAMFRGAADSEGRLEISIW